MVIRVLEIALGFLLSAMTLVAVITGEWVIAQWAVLSLILLELEIWHKEWREK